MGSGRKHKGHSRGKDGKKREGKSVQPANNQEDAQNFPVDQYSNLGVAERVQIARPFWESLSDEERKSMLTIPLSEIEKELLEGIDNEDEFSIELKRRMDYGLKRLKDHSTWKAWCTWKELTDSNEVTEIYDGEQFRKFLQEQYPQEFKDMLKERDWGSKTETAAETALRLRMHELIQQVHSNTVQMQDEVPANKRLNKRAQEQVVNARGNNVDMITLMLEALEHEHELLYHSLLFPVTEFVCESLPANQRESSREELFFEDLDKVPQEQVARICDFLTEKIDALSARMKPDPNEEDSDEEEGGMGDVDLLQVDDAGVNLVVNPKWLNHLEERRLGEDGHPRKVPPEENKTRVGLVLDWIYGSIVSTAEKSRDAARKSLGEGCQSIAEAYEGFLAGLQEQSHLEQKKSTAKNYLTDMVRTRKLSSELAEQVSEMQKAKNDQVQTTNPSEDTMDYLPDHVSYEMLKREQLLTEAKLFASAFEHEISEKKLRTLKAQLRQSEPEFERLKRELDELKNNPRGFDGTYRTQAEMERQRAQMADQAIEEQLEVQQAFREQGAQLKMIYDKRQQCELEMAQRSQEMKQLQGWKKTVQAMAKSFQDMIHAGQNEKEPEITQATQSKVENAQDIEQAAATYDKLRIHFQKEIRKQLYTDEDDRRFFDWIKTVLKELEKRIDAGYAALSHLETMIVNLACDDPGAAIGASIALPRHQKCIDKCSHDFMTRKAHEAEAEILRLEKEEVEKERQEKEKKAKKRNKQKEEKRARSLAEKKAKEEAQKREEELAQKKQLEEEERIALEKEKRLAEMKARRKLEEEVIERRRVELESQMGPSGIEESVNGVDSLEEVKKDEESVDNNAKNPMPQRRALGDEAALPMPRSKNDMLRVAGEISNASRTGNRNFQNNLDSKSQNGISKANIPKKASVLDVEVEAQRNGIQAGSEDAESRILKQTSQDETSSSSTNSHSQELNGGEESPNSVVNGEVRNDQPGLARGSIPMLHSGAPVMHPNLPYTSGLNPNAPGIFMPGTQFPYSGMPLAGGPPPPFGTMPMYPYPPMNGNQMMPNVVTSGVQLPYYPVQGNPSMAAAQQFAGAHMMAPVVAPGTSPIHPSALRPGAQPFVPKDVKVGEDNLKSGEEQEANGVKQKAHKGKLDKTAKQNGRKSNAVK